jgi:hypothetical protein
MIISMEMALGTDVDYVYILPEHHLPPVGV